MSERSTDLVRAFCEPFRSGDTSTYGEIQGGRIVVTWHLEYFAGLLAQLSAPADTAVRRAWS